jgi:putative oxidoreductase
LSASTAVRSASPRSAVRPATDTGVLARDIGLLAVRGTVGLLLVGHGAQKLFGVFGGLGLDGTAKAFGTMGYTPAKFFAWLTGASELTGGLLLVLGLLTPLGAAAIIGVMVNAIVTVHWSHGVWAPEGFEFPFLVAMVSTGLGFTGPGRLSLDRGRSWADGGLTPGLFSLALGLVAALVVLAIKAA